MRGRAAIAAGMLLLMLGVVVAGLAGWRAVHPPPSDGAAPVVHLVRGARPVVARAPRDPSVPLTPSARGRPGPRPTGPVLVEPAVPDPSAGPRQIAIEDLDPDALEALGKVAMERLHQLVEACDDTVSDREDLGAFLVLDPRGVARLDVRPIARDPGPIVVEDRPLPDELVECLDDALWDQDWSVAAATIPAGAELPLALTMRLHEDEP